MRESLDDILFIYPINHGASFTLSASLNQARIFRK